MLRAAGAEVEIVSPELNRPFQAGDSRGKLLVFACTGDKAVNRAVLADARAHNVPCCCADMNWADADFTTPAVARVPGATVAVSTNGASCANAKKLRDDIAAFLHDAEASRIVLFGTSDKVLPSNKRAQYHLSPDARREMIGFLHALKGVDEICVLNTCNRVEVAISGSVDAAIMKRLMRFHRLSPDEYYVLENGEAFAHLVRVTAGLESAMLGEFHVVSQVKDAIAEALAGGTMGGRLKGFFDEVLRVAKLVRHEVEDIVKVSEIERVAADYLRATRDLQHDRVVVMGSGAVGSGVAREIPDATVIHHGEAIPTCDVLVTALASDAPVVTEAVPGRFVLDLGMPPNVADNVPHISLDDLKLWHRRRTGSLDEVFARAEAVIAAEASAAIS